jgi:hypothetical protein
MKPKRIEIDFTIPIDVWADENRGVIMDSIYSNVFDFVESKDDDRIILQIIPILTKKSRMQRPVEPPVKVDFIISKEDIDLTLKKMLEYYIEVEEYEKCAEIHKLQTTPPKKKRGRPKKTINK